MSALLKVIENGPLPLFNHMKSKDVAYPIEALDGVLASMANAIHESVQAPLPLCGQAVLVTAALVSQGFKNVEIDGRIIPLSLFSMIIGESGERKSAVDKLAMAPIVLFEENLQSEYEKNLNEYKKSEEVFLLLKSNLKKELKGETDAIEIGKKMSALEDMTRAPLVPIMTTKDATIQGLIKHLRNAIPSMGVFTDEGAVFFGGHSMSKEKAQQTIALYSQAWDGAPLDMMRSEAEVGAFRLMNRRISMSLMVQPIIAKEVFSSPLLMGQGFIPRFLITSPPSTMGSRFYRSVDITNDLRFKNYFACLIELLKEGLSIENDGSLQLTNLKLNQSAKDAYILFHDEIEGQLTFGGTYQHISGTAAKIAEQALRIAGVLNVINHGTKNNIISQREMRSGIDLARYSLHQLINIKEKAIIPREIELARVLLAWIAKCDFKFLYSSLDANKRPSSIRPKQFYKVAVDVLEEYGYLLEMGAVDIDGIMRKEVYQVLSCTEAKS